MPKAKERMVAGKSTKTASAGRHHYNSPASATIYSLRTSRDNWKGKCLSVKSELTNLKRRFARLKAHARPASPPPFQLLLVFHPPRPLGRLPHLCWILLRPLLHLCWMLLPMSLSLGFWFPRLSISSLSLPRLVSNSNSANNFLNPLLGLATAFCVCNGGCSLSSAGHRESLLRMRRTRFLPWPAALTPLAHLRCHRAPLLCARNFLLKSQPLTLL